MSELTTFLEYICVWIIFGGFAFLLAFIKGLIGYRDLLKPTLDKEKQIEQQHIILLCATKASEYFIVGFSLAFSVWSGILLNDPTGLLLESTFLSFNTLVYMIAFELCVIIIPQNWWVVIAHFLKTIFTYFGHPPPEKIAAELAKINADIEKTKKEAEGIKTS